MAIPTETTRSVSEANLLEQDVLMPPPAPRAIASSYAWQLLFSDGWAMAALIFGLVGAIFTFVGLILTLGIITAFVGIPFAGLGLLLLVGGGGVVVWRYQAAQQTVEVLRGGTAVEGQIVQVEENVQVRVNRRHPWVIRYTFRVGGRAYAGQVSTLNMPGTRLQVGHRACILYLPNAPEQNVLYPHP